MKAGDVVLYVPSHAGGDINHEDCEQGIVSSLNSRGEPFVKFFKQLSKFGWEGTTSQCCCLSDVVVIKSEEHGNVG